MAQDDSLNIVTVNEKSFLSLKPAPAPDGLIWGDFGEKIESFYGVTAYSNGSKEKGRKYQCTELAHRFAREIYGIPTRIGMGLGHGKDLARKMAAHFSKTKGTSDSIEGYKVKLEYFANKKTPYPPVVGSIVSMYFASDNSGYGHVGVIRKINELEDGTLEAILFDQHGFVHKEVGISIEADKMYFTKDAEGNWHGEVLSWLFKERYDLTGWTNPVVVSKPVSIKDASDKD